MFELLTPTTVRLNNVQSRKEHHGEDLVAAIDLSLTWATNNRALAMVHPDLRASLYCDMRTPAERAQVEMDLPVDELPNIRFTKLTYPLKLETEQSGMTLRVDYGLGDGSDLILMQCKLSKIRITPIEGGSTEIKWSLSSASDIDERITGKLSMLQQQDIVITLLQPAVEGSDAVDGNPEGFGFPFAADGDDALSEEDVFNHQPGDPESTPAPEKTKVSKPKKLTASDVFIDQHGGAT